jgi:MYXO-CTERM domain-containing protein
MKTRFPFVLASSVVIAAVSGPAAAATVDLAFKIKITEGTSPLGGAATGQIFDGLLSYDDSDLASGLPFSRSPFDGGLTMTFPFLDRTLTEIDSDVAEEPRADFAADGSLLGLTFSVDVPNAFFFFVIGTEFTYDYSKLVFNEETGENDQVTFADGKGVLNPVSDPPTVPLPATAPLLLAALLGGAALRRRR